MGNVLCNVLFGNRMKPHFAVLLVNHMCTSMYSHQMLFNQQLGYGIYFFLKGHFIPKTWEIS